MKYSDTKQVLLGLGHRFKYAFWIFVFLLALTVTLFLKFMYVEVGPDQGGVLYKRFSGTQLDQVYREGSHIISPFDLMTVYVLSPQKQNIEFTVLSQDGLPVEINASFKYSPEVDFLPRVHQTIGPDYVSKVLIPELQSLIREEFGNVIVSDINASSDVIVEQITSDPLGKANQENAKWFNVHSLEFNSLKINSLEDNPTSY